MSHYNNSSPNGIGNKQNSEEFGSFQKSVMSNNKESIQKHLSHMKIQSNQLNYALFLSIDHFRLDEHTEECVLLLLRHKANPNCQLSKSNLNQDKQTPLTAACRKGQQFLVKTLLENGAKADLCNKNGQHPLSVILKDKRQNYDVAHTLFNYMASVNIEIGGRNPIVITVERQFLRIFQMLIEKGANLVFESENILHIVVKKKFKKLDKKKKFIKELAGKLFLMQEDSSHKLPTDYQENQQIRLYILQNFKPKVQKQESYKQQSNSKSAKEKQSKQNSKHKDTELNSNKKKNLNHKELDTSFSEIDEEQFQDQKGQPIQDGKKLKEVVEIPEEEQRNENKQSKQTRKLSHEKETNTNSPSIQRKLQAINPKQSESLSSVQLKQIKKQKSPEKIQFDTIIEKQKEEQKQKIKKKLNNNLGVIEPKKKPNTNLNVIQINSLGTKKKKQKNEQLISKQLISKTLLKRKNSSIEEESIKLDKNKGTVKKSNTGKKQLVQCQEKMQKEKIQEQDKNLEAQKNKISMLEQKLQKQSETDSQEGYQGCLTTLSQQIYELVHKIDEKYQQKIGLVQQIVKFLEDIMRKQIQKRRQNARLELYLYGSQSTGLAIEHSDIDLLVLTEFEAGQVMKLLQQQQTLKIDGINQVKFIPGATVPVIKLKMSDKFDNIHVDITFNNRNHMGLKCSQMIKSFMHAEPLLRPLVLVIKVLVDSYDISDPYKGGLSSYAITLMVIALLQFTQKSKKTLDNVGELLLNFLYFYGEQIDYISQSIFIHALGLEQPIQCIYPLPYITDLNPKLIIYDPLNPVNNVGRTTYRIAALKKLFSVSYLQLKSDPRCQLKDIFDGSFNQVLTDF